MILRIRSISFVAVVSSIALGALAAGVASLPVSVTGDVSIELCRRDGQGAWVVVDRMKAPASFSVSVSDLASGKELKTDFVWNGRSEQGRQASVRWARAAKANLNAERGLLELEVPIEFTIDGKRQGFIAKMTTDSVVAPLGSIRGEKAVLVDGTLTAGLVGTSTFRSALLSPVEGRETRKAGTSGTKQARPTSPVEELAVVIKGKGTARK